MNPLSTFVPPRLRAALSQARRYSLAQPPIVRGLLASALVAGFVSLLYLAGQPFTPASKTYLGRSFSRDELDQIRRTLEAGRIAYSIDSRQRLQIASDQFDAATSLLSKLTLGPRSIEELRNESTISSIFDSEADKQRKAETARAKILEAFIGRLDGVASSFVRINLSKPAAGIRQPPKVSAFVWVETWNNARLSFRTVEAIKQYIVKNVSDLTPDSVTVMDLTGYTYLDAGHSELQTNTHDRAIEEQLKQEIFERLDWIKGVRVSVQLTASPPQHEPAVAPAITPAARPAPIAAPGPSVSQWARKDAKAPASPKSAAKPRVVVVANQPSDPEAVSLESEPATAPIVERPAVAPKESPAVLSQAGPEKVLSGRIGVDVPRSFYYQNYMIASSGEKNPSPEAIRPSMKLIDSKIRESVKMTIPGPSDSWDIRIEMLPDDVPLVRPPAPAQGAESRRQFVGWEVIGGVVVLTLVASVWGIFRLGRRPELRATTTSGARRFHRDSPSDPAPSERVRELVRRNPQAAASVLQRWVGQGDDGA